MDEDSPQYAWKTVVYFRSPVRTLVQADEALVLAGQSRYGTRDFPAYRFIPGQSPHPRRHPQGHSFRQPEPRPLPFKHDEWAASEDYLHAVDLYNFAYWWEAHEVFEGLWHACGRTTVAGNFFQGLIQLAGANLKRVLGNEPAAKKLVRSGLLRLLNNPVHYMGMDTAAFSQDITLWVQSNNRAWVRIRLDEQTHARSMSTSS
jgi:uncharacterized protein